MRSRESRAPPRRRRRRRCTLERETRVTRDEHDVQPESREHIQRRLQAYAPVAVLQTAQELGTDAEGSRHVRLGDALRATHPLDDGAHVLRREHTGAALGRVLSRWGERG